MKWLVFTLFSLFFCATTAHAKIYKCVDGDGRLSFQDTPCPDTTKEESVNIKPDSAAAPREFSGELLVGKWCEYAVSMDLEGAKDTSRPATWHFKDKSKMSYTYKTKRKPKKEIFNKYSVKNNLIKVDNAFIGNWEVASFSGLTLILAGPVGYAHLRRGSC